MEPLTSTIRYLRFPYLQIALKAVIGITFITSSFGVENKASSDWWSLQPIEEISPPEVTHKNLVKNPIDSFIICLLYTSPSPRDLSTSRMPSSA